MSQHVYNLVSSPSCRYLAFVVSEAEEHRLLLLDTKNQQARLLDRLDDNRCRLAWTSNETRVAWARFETPAPNDASASAGFKEIASVLGGGAPRGFATNLFLSDLENGHTVTARFPTIIKDLAWADEQVLAVAFHRFTLLNVLSGGGAAVSFVDARTGRVTRKTNTPRGLDIPSLAAFLPGYRDQGWQHTYLASRFEVVENDSGQEAQTVLVRIDGRRKEAIVLSKGGDIAIGTSPSGRFVAFSHFGVPVGRFKNEFGANFTAMPSGALLCWAADGSKQVIVEADCRLAALSWWDENNLLYAVEMPSGARQVRAMDLASGARETLFDLDPAAAGGPTLIAGSAARGEVWLAEGDSSAPAALICHQRAANWRRKIVPLAVSEPAAGRDTTAR